MDEYARADRRADHARAGGLYDNSDYHPNSGANGLSRADGDVGTDSPTDANADGHHRPDAHPYYGSNSPSDQPTNAVGNT